MTLIVREDCMNRKNSHTNNRNKRPTWFSPLSLVHIIFYTPCPTTQSCLHEYYTTNSSNSRSNMTNNSNKCYLVPLLLLLLLLLLLKTVVSISLNRTLAALRIILNTVSICIGRGSGVGCDCGRVCHCADVRKTTCHCGHGCYNSWDRCMLG
ncbi:hypothetical protein BDB00DRAFT_62390 [Zychaea mexicana]|uniref:uncharacterized protein n=1 Tax=Zychaea mexicana TaxID=64656 RepID=UPI0022FE017B|nr:uncharacterized protein BDB00DRAFT_62390 [Zychaea mexicana]KAI9488168.1 hypothetical protein BDB00DRAFT_62390 [Zychaea mexicana]